MKLTYTYSILPVLKPALLVLSLFFLLFQHQRKMKLKLKHTLRKLSWENLSILMKEQSGLKKCW